MEKSVNTLTDLDKILKAFELQEQDYRQFPALTLAYIGDCVFELVIRTAVVFKNQNQVNHLHKKSAQIVKAETQAVIVQALLDKELLTEEERAVYKRGRNTKSHTVAKNASVAAYRKATGFEAIVGYLYVTGQMERVIELTRTGLTYIDFSI